MSLAGYVFAYLASLLFAISDILVRKATGRGIPPYGNLFLSLTVGIPLLALAGLMDPPLEDIAVVSAYMAVGVLHFYLGRLLFYTAVAGLGASSSAILVSATPLAASVMAWIMLGEDLTTRLMISLILILVASYIAMRNPSGRPYHNVGRLRAIASGVTAVLIFSLSTVAVRWLGFMTSSPVVGALSSYVGAYPLAIATLHLGLARGGSGTGSWSKSAIVLASLGGASVAFAQASRYTALDLISVPEASVLFGLFPVNTALLSAFVGGEEEKPGKKHGIAAFLAFAAVVIAFYPT